MDRFYRRIIQPGGLVENLVSVEETDLQILAEKDIREVAEKIVRRLRKEIETYIAAHSEFTRALSPLEVDDAAPDTVKIMASAASAAGVGPMAAVAGTIAELVGKALATQSPEIIVENGGDIYLRSSSARKVALYAGTSPLSMKIGLKLDPVPHGIGVCTSSATVGHSLSFGKADAVVILGISAPLADAVATATCNRVTLPSSLEPALEFATSIDGIFGAVIVLDKHLAATGTGFEIVEL